MPDEIVAVAETPAQPTPERSWLTSTVHWTRDLMVSVAIAVVVILFIYQPVKVEGTSMEPSLENDERIFINKFVYRFGLSDVSRGDMVVFWFPNDLSKSYIKRVIGIPGDSVEVNDGIVMVNGHRLDETYIPERFRDRSHMLKQQVPPDEYFVMGDHRSSSNDSRSWGTVPRRYIYGKAVFAYWPFNRVGVVN